MGSGRAVHVEGSMTCIVAVDGSRRAAEGSRGAVEGSRGEQYRGQRYRI